MQESNTKKMRFLGDHVYLIINLYRPGAATLITRLEYENYSPDDPDRNDLFSLYLNQSMGQPHAVIGVPTIDLESIVQPLVEQLDLKLVKGVPSQVVSPTEIKPLLKIDHSPDLVYTVENRRGTISDPIEHKRLITEEQISLKKYMANLE